MEKSFYDRIMPTACYAIGSCTAEIFAQPMFKVKTIYQTSEDKVTLRSIVKNIYREFGIMGFYTAVLSAIFARLVSSFCKFLIYCSNKNLKCEN